MSIEQQLKEMILSQYSSIREFSIAINMPYSTLDSIFRRGVENASIANIIKICKQLSISADELASGQITMRTVDGLSSEENEIIRLYRSLNTDGKALVMSTVRTFAGNPDMQKEKSNAVTA